LEESGRPDKHVSITHGKDVYIAYMEGIEPMAMTENNRIK